MGYIHDCVVILWDPPPPIQSEVFCCTKSEVMLKHSEVFILKIKVKLSLPLKSLALALPPCFRREGDRRQTVEGPNHCLQLHYAVTSLAVRQT